MASEDSPVPPRPSETEAEPDTDTPAEINSPDNKAEKPSLDKRPETPSGDRQEQANKINSESPAGGSEGGSEGGSPADSTSSQESGEVSPSAPADSAARDSNSSNAPPLPNEQPPPVEDDGWDFQWDQTHQAYFFYNRFTNEATWDNPRLRSSAAAGPSSAAAAAAAAPTSQDAPAEPPKNERPPAGGYNPAIHGDYDPNAWYAKGEDDPEGSGEQDQTVDPASAQAAIGSFNRFTGKWQAGDLNPERHSDEAKSRRQMNAFFDVDAAANSHDGRSLKAERSGKKPTKAELKAFKEKRRAKKEEKRRAWLRD